MTAVPAAAQQQQRQQRSDSIQAALAARDRERAAQLYVSTRWEDHSLTTDFAADLAGKARTDSVYTARTRGVMDYRKLTYRSKVGDLDIPAYLYQPLQKRGPRGHAAMIW
ncbi:MAG: hypothetical protein AAB295_01400 [Chloroflexota bacterium]